MRRRREATWAPRARKCKRSSAEDANHIAGRWLEERGSRVLSQGGCMSIITGTSRASPLDGAAIGH